MPSSRLFLTQGTSWVIFCLLHWQASSLPLVPSRKPNTAIETYKIYSCFFNSEKLNHREINEKKLHKLECAHTHVYVYIYKVI